MTELINTAVVHCLAKIMPLSSETTLKEIFFKACRGNELNKVRSVLTLDADVNWRDADGLSGVHFAARYNFGELLELLLAHTGVDVNIRHLIIQTPLIVACEWGHEDIVRRLC